MSRFYGIVKGQARTEATRRGSSSSGLTTKSASWNGAVITTLYEDKNGNDCFSIKLDKWYGKGITKIIHDSRFIDNYDQSYVYSIILPDDFEFEKCISILESMGVGVNIEEVNIYINKFLDRGILIFDQAAPNVDIEKYKIDKNAFQFIVRVFEELNYIISKRKVNEFTSTIINITDDIKNNINTIKKLY